MNSKRPTPNTPNDTPNDCYKTAGAAPWIHGAIDPELSVLGPVGFWLAHTLGPTLSLVVGVAWPLCLGTAALVRAERILVRSDVVG